MSGTEDAVVDLSALDSLHARLGSEFREVLVAFITDARERLVRLRVAAEQGDADELRSEAHSLKGSSASVRAHQMAMYCSELEQQARTGNVVEAQVKVQAIATSLDAACRLLETRLERW